MNDTPGVGPLAAAGSIDFLDDAINRLVDDRLAAADEAVLDAVLAENDAALRRYCEWMQLHADLHWEYPAAVAREPGFGAVGQTSPDVPDRSDDEGGSPGVPGLWAAVGLLVLVGGWLALFRPAAYSPAVPIAHVVATDGAADWSGLGSVSSSPVVMGQHLAAGCVRLEGETALTRLRFDDGTEIEVARDAVVEFEDDGQKRIVLRKGTMSVDARPQPPGRPMLVRTPTAEVEVVGTEFSLSVDAAATHVGVTEGQVRFKRMADGSGVDVPANSVSMASLAASSPLAVTAPTAPPDAFVESFSRPSGRSEEMGRWLPADGDLPPRMAAIPYVAGRKATARPTIHHGVGLDAQPPGFAAFHRDSVVRVRLRTSKPAEINCMIGMWMPSGAFGGNFLATFTPSASGDASGGADGWRTIEVAAAALRPLCEGYGQIPVGAGVQRVVVNSIERDVGLEVAEVAIERPER